MAAREGQIQHIRLRPIWIKEHTDGGNVIYAVGAEDKTSHIGDDTVLMNAVGEETTFKDLGDIVKAKIKFLFEGYEQVAIKFLIAAGESEENAHNSAQKMVQLFNQKFFDSDLSINAIVFRPFSPDSDELTEKGEPDVLGDDDADTYDLHDEANVIIDCVEADEDDSEYTTIFFGRVKVNEDIEGILCAGSGEVNASAKVHKGGWEQSLIDAANAALEARQM